MTSFTTDEGGYLFEPVDIADYLIKKIEELLEEE